MDGRTKTLEMENSSRITEQVAMAFTFTQVGLISVWEYRCQ